MSSIKLSTLKTAAAAEGLNLIGALGLKDALLSLAPNVARLAAWQQAGYAAEMKYMLRDPQLFASFAHILPQCRNVLIFAVPYQEQPGIEVTAKHGFGRVARYAWGLDYHQVLKKKLAALVAAVQRHLPNQKINCRYFSDAVPLLERALAAAVQLGFIGRNTLLIRPGVGSFTFIAEVLCDFEIDTESAPASAADSLNVLTADRSAGENCGSCSRCLSACPTGALKDSGVLDAGTCISYLTIEKRSDFNEWEQSAIGDWLFGCDICQEVCPFNHKNVDASSVEEFSAAAGVGAYIELKSLFTIRTTEAFKKKFGGTALLRAGRELLLRNACCIIANQGCYQALDELSAAAKDPSELVRRHARWSLLRLRENAEGLDLMRVKRSLDRDFAAADDSRR